VFVLYASLIFPSLPRSKIYLFVAHMRFISLSGPLLGQTVSAMVAGIRVKYYTFALSQDGVTFIMYATKYVLHVVHT
jgi:hypothetical protein